MYQAITTRYLTATNHRGARIKASCPQGHGTKGRDYDRDIEDDHRDAACALALKLGWFGQWATGCVKDGVYVSVWVQPKGGNTISHDVWAEMYDQ